ncbi:signal peptidase I [Rhodococcoides fascians]|uniref:signal peptidase I n=1 Tax=Rhodococcoides fascians TaxID=1828 RepID=UPI00068F9275|nr:MULTISPECIES: signal peptidase I [Rhodococcus]OZE99354.1 signal peptidase I [Rhodococcus sp. 15-1189-1-1a]OZF13648.1 signal peptidase I [Rhodococcus sp. 14-2686-1-2]
MTQARHSTSSRSAWSRIGDWILNILALGGVVCIGLVICAFAFNITLIMFKTGSMSPAIPAGSLAVVQRVPAASVEVGDVVTVDRVNELPVTHRVVTVDALPESGKTYLELKGDANEYADQGLYEVTEVRKVLWSVPGLARVIVYFSNPIVLGGITIAMAGLVVAVFWPRRSDGSGTEPSAVNAGVEVESR